jgi:hypothetical protein
MQAMASIGITRDVWESDKRVEPNWWIGDSVCDYCLIKKCEYCYFGKRKSTTTYSDRNY